MAAPGDNPANEGEEEWRALREIGDIRAGTTFLFSFRFGESTRCTNRSSGQNKKICVRFRREAPLAITGDLLGPLWCMAIAASDRAGILRGNGDGDVWRAAYTRGRSVQLDDGISFGLHWTGDLFGGVRNSGHRCRSGADGTREQRAFDCRVGSIVFTAGAAAGSDFGQLYALFLRAVCYKTNREQLGQHNYCGGASVPVPIFVVEPKRL